MSDIRSARNFAHLSRAVPMFFSVEEVHEKLSKLLGNFFLTSSSISISSSSLFYKNNLYQNFTILCHN